MYEDYKGEIKIDTVDHITSIEEYAKINGVDTDKFKVLRIKTIAVRDSFSTEFICKEKGNIKDEEFSFKANGSIFKEFFKTTEIIIENK